MKMLYRNQPTPMILIIDTETSGLPKRIGFNQYYKYTDSDKYSSSRLIEIACVLCDQEGKIVRAGEWLIKPDGFSLPTKITELTGITDEELEKNGMRFADVAVQFQDFIDKADILVMHNAAFDVSIIAAECYRQGFEALAERVASIPVFCTMEKGKHFTQLRLPRGDLKPPRLQELYHHFFGENFGGAHRAMNDVSATAKCYFKMR